MKWIAESLQKLWDGFLQNIGVVLSAFLLSGGYLVVINFVNEAQEAVRKIPTDYVLTPFVLLTIVLGVVLRINHKQRQELTSIREQTPKDDHNARFVTHFGVWWKLYPDEEYVEDFPYCPCCEPKKKLIQTEWFEDEIYKCPQTNTEIKLYDRVPRKKEDVLEWVYNAYFRDRGQHLEEHLFKEFRRIKELHPEKGETVILDELFSVTPLSRLPEVDIVAIRKKYSKHQEIFLFLRRYYSKYRKHLEVNEEQPNN